MRSVPKLPVTTPHLAAMAPKKGMELITHQVPHRSRVVGALAITSMLSCFAVGPMIPFIILGLALLGYYQAAATKFMQSILVARSSSKILHGITMQHYLFIT